MSNRVQMWIFVLLVLFPLRLNGSNSNCTAKSCKEQSIEAEIGPAGSKIHQLSLDLKFFYLGTSRGLRCLKPCSYSQEQANYICKTESYEIPAGDSEAGWWTWDYCSPRAGLDSKGKPCTEACRRHSGESGVYKWCSKTVDDWGYCGVVWLLERTSTLKPATATQSSFYPWSIYVYQHVNYEGSSRLYAGAESDCADVDPVGLKTTKGYSVDTKYTCARIYSSTNCTGQGLKLAPENNICHNDLRSCGFNARIVSIGSCSS